MKYFYAALVVAGSVAAHPHQHGHHHAHKQASLQARDVEIVTVAGPVVITYVLNGVQISKSEVDRGIANGTLIWVDGAPAQNVASPRISTISVTSSKSKVTKTSTTSSSVIPPPPPPPPPSSSSTTTSSATQTPATVQAAIKAVSKASSASPPPAPSVASTSSASGSGSGSGSSSQSGSGVNSPFPDGQISCSTFPSSYGALSLSYLNLGGWTGIQDSSSTAVQSCSEGTYCSYACPAGYQKSQWPSSQGSTGQSIGGLLCSGGMLHLTNPTLSKNLCIPGTSAVNVVAQNNLNGVVSVCRTDYPGSESETVPVAVSPGGSQPLTCPDASAYYVWTGKSTSAQYYVNPEGYGPSDACIWGDSSKPLGNFAPVNIGVGYSNGQAYVSIFPNAPTTNANLAYKITVSADATGQTCTYNNGVYSSSIGADSTSGCTIAAPSGTITYTFHY